MKILSYPTLSYTNHLIQNEACSKNSIFVDKRAKLEVSSGFLPSELVEPRGRLGGKIAGARRDGGHYENIAY